MNAKETSSTGPTSILGDGDWSEHFDKASGRNFYYNKRTGVRSWTKPAELCDVIVSKVGSELGAKTADDDWSEHVDPSSGRSFFYNRKTNESTWTLPANALPKAWASMLAGLSAKPADDWSEHVDPTTGEVFYCNIKTGVSTWTKPTEPCTDVSNAATDSGTAKASVWSEHVDPVSGNAFYHNATTGETTWTMPADFSRAGLSPGAAQTAAPDSESMKLSDKWSEHVDPASGRLYYHNKRTGRATWTKPDDFNAIEASVSGALSTPKSVNEWSEQVDPVSRRVYYYNRKTGAASWVKPEAPVVAALPCRQSTDPLSENMDPSSGTFHHNSETDEKVRTKPADNVQGAGAGSLLKDKSTDDWSEHIDKESGRLYYYNAKTSESSWTKPSEAVTARARSASAQRGAKARAALRLPAGWECRSGTKGQTLYFARVTGESVMATPTLSPNSDLLAKLHDLGVACSTASRAERPSDQHRANVRDGTKAKVAKELGLATFGCRPSEAFSTLPLNFKATVLFQDSGEGMWGRDSSEGYLLGRFEVLAVSASADFDAEWRFLSGTNRQFCVLHAAALNIGENEKATDFNDYCGSSGRLDMSAYVEDMGRIFENLLNAAVRLHANDVVWPPFGMGAFLRNLHKLDSWYSGRHRDGALLVELRHAVASRFVDTFVKKVSTTSNLRVHLCVAPSDAGDEGDANAAAFLKALHAAVKRGKLPAGAARILCYADALMVAQDLANEGRAVALVNGANRQLIGNHWFEDGAARAIDENLHRRSWRLAAMAYQLNAGCQAEAVHAQELSRRVRQVGGRVHALPKVSTRHLKSNIIAKFQQIDANGDGFISKDELGEVLAYIGMKASDKDQVFRIMDADKDGRISYAEFVNWLYGWSRPDVTFRVVAGA
eukprot:TRINITY_DN106144_c0_g1_i1.p1 TRINITY_DN106144_c0_g1~~TRINITY_DN106144_c0_g1_i1.p1  ORF type:complete len:892 (+),score=140.00 TRINITY_DN106144_c0_g1_i1:140-2815(+)